MFYRKAMDELQEWKDLSKGRSAVLIEGARRVGKSTLAEEFAKSAYKSHILIDFSKQNRDVEDIFTQNSNDFDRLSSLLSTYFDTRLYPRESLLVFDEVQMFPFARQMVKHLVADGRYDIVETGSLISLKQNVRDIVIPSEERTLELYPLDFEEFCLAQGSELLTNAIKEAFVNLQPLPNALHRKAQRLWREYLLVGGMPGVVDAYLPNLDFHEADSMKRDILSLYRKDIAKFTLGEESQVSTIFDAIAAQLSKHNKKFTFSTLGKNMRWRNLEAAFFWLTDSRIVNLCHNVTDPTVGLSLSADPAVFKCFLGDTGLLVAQVFSDQKTTPNELYKEILFKKIGFNEGMLVENLVAQSLRANGHKLFFFSKNDRDSSKNTMEVDFLITGKSNKSARTKIHPIEVKSTSRYSTTSLDKFAAKFGKRVGTSYVLHPGQLKVTDTRIHLPLYMAFCL